MGKEIDLKGRGRSLYLAVKLGPFSIKETTKKAGFKPNTFYSHIGKEKLDFTILAKYGSVIKYDFSVEYPEMGDFFPLDTKQVSTNLNDNKEYNNLNEKYLKLLESHKDLLNKYHDLEMKWLKRDQ